MNKSASPIAKQCINSLCRKTDLTEFSTCRYCSFAYVPEPSRNRGSILDNPMPLLKLGCVVASIFSSLYLVSVFGHSTGSYHSYGSRRYGAGASSIPAAFVVFFSQKMLAKADDDIQASNSELGRNPKNFDAYIKRGDAYWTKSMLNEALTDYTAAIALSPMSADAYDKRSIIYDTMGLSEKAQKDKQCAALYRK